LDVWAIRWCKTFYGKSFRNSTKPEIVLAVWRCNVLDGFPDCFACLSRDTMILCDTIVEHKAVVIWRNAPEFQNGGPDLRLRITFSG